MKKFKLLAVVAAAGLLGLSARATAITNVDLVTVKATILVQTNNTSKGTGTNIVTTYNVAKIKITTKDILVLIDDEFGTTYADTNGTKLAVDAFFDGTMEVLDAKGNVLIADASNDSDDYELYIDYDNYVYTGTDNEKTGKTTYEYSTDGEFYYHADSSASDADQFDVYGTATVDQTYDNPKFSESFDLPATGEGYIVGHETIVSGEVKGTGKNNPSID